MGEIVNLRRHRKRLARTDAERDAAANRLKHGAPAAERRRERAERERTERSLGDHRLEDGKQDG